MKEIKIGELAAADHSIAARPGAAADPRDGHRRPATAAPPAAAVPHRLPPDRTRARRSPRIAAFDAEFRSSFGYDQPATPLAAMGVIAAATGDTASKYVARRETPLYIPENCTQCMECISVCPDTALPNTSQDLGTVLTHRRHPLRRRSPASAPR